MAKVALLALVGLIMVWDMRLVTSVKYTSSGERIIYKEDLPLKAVLSQKRFNVLKNKLMIIARFNKEREGEIDELLSKLSTLPTARAGVSDVFCCQQERPEDQKVTYYFAKGFYAAEVIYAGGSVKCGVFGWSRCGSSTQRTMAVTRYRAMADTTEVTPDAWVNGCPESQITCCGSYFYNKRLDNCYDFNENFQLVQLQNQYCYYDLGFFEDFTPVPYSESCPVIQAPPNPPPLPTPPAGLLGGK